MYALNTADALFITLRLFVSIKEKVQTYHHHKELSKSKTSISF